MQIILLPTSAWKILKHGFSFGPYFPVFFWSVFPVLRKSPYSFRKQGNMDQKKLHIWTLFTQWTCVTFFIFSANESKFPNTFKQGNVTSAFKKGYRGSKENYRTINILSVIAKIFERLLSKQGAIFMDQVLSK